MLIRLIQIIYWRAVLSVGVVLTMAAFSSAWIRCFPRGKVTFHDQSSFRFFSGNSDPWHGSMTPFSEYAMHVLVGERDAPVTVQDAIRQSMKAKVEHVGNSSQIPVEECKLTPQQLLQLGSIWFLPRDQHEHNQLGVIHSSYKPLRLLLQNSTTMLQEGDYMRIHHTPRRFSSVYNFNWKDKGHQDSVSSNDCLPSVIVHSHPDFWIINKPPLIPVHATVDNAVENVVHQLASANRNSDYVVTTQRIDINTSGLLVVARNIQFASYFAQLLRHKTKLGETNIVKRYTCLVCLQSSDDESVVQAWQRLQNLTNTTIRHYLEPSDRAPKRFELNPPSDDTKSWLECLLSITNVSKIHPIPNENHSLARRLWTSGQMPSTTKAVCEVSVQLETGRTHQIRGQLSKLGYPLVGDEQYGGAIPILEASIVRDPQLLALQSSYIGFWDAEYVPIWSRKRRANVTQGIPSDRWIETSLERAWWTPILEQECTDDSMTSLTDVQLVQNMRSIESTPPTRNTCNEKPELLPPAVQLSPGKNKYVLVKAESQQIGDVYWFVKSASPKECGGPYHANVAKDLVEWIQAAGFNNISITGGGRIDYCPSSNRAHVYGFSYGFGKGDHAKVSALVTEAGFLGSFDNSNTIY